MKDNQVSQIAKPAGVPLECQSNPQQRILMVDDELAIREISVAVLGRCGYEVDTAKDGQAGWEALQAKSYDLLITDQNMPKLSGVELVKKLRSEDMALPVILISGLMPAGELNRHAGLLFAATLPKPFSIEELLGTVKKALCAGESAKSGA